MNEPQTYERLGAVGGIVGIFIGLSKLGLFRALREKWNSPTTSELMRESLKTTAMMREAIDGLAVSHKRLAETQDRQCTALEGIASTLTSINDATIITEAMMNFLGDRESTPMFKCELPSGRCVWTNKALQVLFGRTKDQMLGWGWVEAIHPAHQDRVISHWKNCAVNSDIYNVDYPIERHDGIINLRAHADFIKDEKTGRKVVALGSVKLMPVFTERAA